METPKLSNDPAAFRHFDLRHDLAADARPGAPRRLARILALLFVLLIVVALIGWLAAS